MQSEKKFHGEFFLLYWSSNLRWPVLFVVVLLLLSVRIAALPADPPSTNTLMLILQDPLEYSDRQATRALTLHFQETRFQVPQQVEHVVPSAWPLVGSHTRHPVY